MTAAKPQTKDAHFMRRALVLAEKGMGRTNPNPMVGAVIVRNGRIIGTGYHRMAGLPHAEIEAMKNARGTLKGATLYVTLEPCAHFGRTPPCADAIIKAGISRVVCATRDPNPLVCGRGIATLRRASIAVSIGTCAKETRILNETFFFYHEKRRPFIGLKFALSLDGKLATRTGDSKWITNGAARRYARGLRSRYDAVLVGIGTVIADDPHLGARTQGKRDPIRIILDSHLRIPLSAQVLRDSNVLVVTCRNAPQSKKIRLEKRGIAVLSFEGNTISIPALLLELGKRGIQSVLVEGGGETLGRFLDAKRANRVYAFYGPVLIGGNKAVSVGGAGTATIQNALRLKAVSCTRFGTTILVSGNL